MNREASVRRFVDADTRAVRRASRMVGLQIAVVSAALVLAVVIAVFLFVISEIKPAELFEPVPDPDNVDVSAIVLLRAAVLVGIILIILAGVMSWLVTRRAVRPLGEALRIQRSFVADASHELRTPLTVLDARLQILQRSLPADDPSASIVIELRRDARSLIQIVNDLLESAESVGSPGSATRVPTELNAVVALAVESMRLIGAERSIVIELADPDRVSTFLPASSAHRCVVALLDNAIRFSPDGSTVRVDLAVTKSEVTLTVRDHGTGIQGIDPARIFDRFAHSGSVIPAGANSAGAIGGGTEARTGFGIGLALVRDIVVRYGGSIGVADSSIDGTAISLTVPRANSR